jgi:hypothetical protein
MTMFPFTQCCELLAIDPKTLRRWVQQTNIPLHQHPTDARIKSLSAEHVQQLATLHGCAIQPLSTTQHGAPHGESERFSPPAEAISSPQQEMDLLTKLVQLETDIATLQEQLAQLRALSPSLHPMTKTTGEPEGEGKHPHRPHPAESRRRRIIPLIEYGADDHYVMLCPQEGELPLEPDSEEWFVWLASLSSFRFVGKQGYLGAFRMYHQGPTRSWYGYRKYHRHRYQYYMGVTETLTVAHLEQIAAKLQADVDTF